MKLRVVIETVPPDCSSSNKLPPKFETKSVQFVASIYCNPSRNDVIMIINTGNSIVSTLGKCSFQTYRNTRIRSTDE